MKKILLYIVLSLASFSAFSQLEEIDKRIAAARSKTDTEPLQALREAEALIDECANLNYDKGLAECYNLQGIVLFTRGLNDMALQSFIRSLEYYQHVDDTVGISLVYNNLGVVSYTISKYHYSIFFFNQSLKIQIRAKKFRNIVDLKNNIGSLYEKLHMYDTAMALHRESVLISRQHDYPVGIATAMNNLAVIYENTGNRDSAVFYYKASLAFHDSIAKSQLALTYSNLARTLLNGGDNESAAEYLDSALFNAIESDASAQLPEIYKLYSQYYESTGEIAKAYQNLKKYKDITEKIESQTTEGDFADFILSMQQSKWQKEKSLLDKQMKLQNRVQWLIIAIIAVALVLFVLLFINIRNRNRMLDQKHALAESEKRRLSEELENKAIIAQLEKEKLTNDLQMKERQLTSMTMHIVTKNETLQEIEKNIDQFVSANTDKGNDASLKKIQSIIRMNAGDEAVWNNYFYHFDQVYPGFFKVLSETHPDITQGEQKLCAYILINLSNKEIAHVMGISEASIKIKKNRLSKKLKLDIASDLTAYLRKFAE
ncbi:MAG: tetratricopeptide repeat protein [Bacteroidales bacterium]|nr:tetratricopeptide repeat protein [Bacteroidales bacterium]